MSKQITLEGSIQVMELMKDIWAVELSLKQTDVVPMCLGLLLLDYQLVDSLFLTQPKERMALSLTMSIEHSLLTSPPQVAKISIVLSQSHVQALISFLLHYYRDGFSPVNHIDIELQGPDDSTLDCTLVVQTDKWAPPLSSEKARRLLEME